MSELTVTLDDGVADALEQMAREKSVPLDAFVVASLSDLVQRHKVRARLRELVETSPIPMKPDWKGSREELYDRPVLRRHERSPVRDDGTP